MSVTYYVSSFDFSVSNTCFACLADSMGLVDLLEKDPKPRRSRRVRKKDDETPIPNQGVPPSEPPSEPEDAEVEVPLVRKSSKTPAAKGVVFKVPPPPAPTKLPEVEGKGKEKVIEPVSKKQKSTHTPSLPLDEPEVRFKVDVKRQLNLHGRSGPLGQGIAMASLDRAVHVMNALGGDIWDRLTDGSSEKLYEFGMHTAFAVSLASFSILEHFLPSLLILLSSLLTRVPCPKFAIAP